MTRRLLLGVFLIAGLAGSIRAQEQKSTIVGHVLDSQQGKPLAGVLVEIVDGPTAFTDERGRFSFDDLDPGPWVLRATRLGYHGMELNIEDLIENQVLVPLVPDPVLLEGLEVTLNRLAERRTSLPYSVRLIPEEDLRNSIRNVADVISDRAGFRIFPCSSPTLPGARAGAGEGLCARIRGTVDSLYVYVDDMRRYGGFEELVTYQARDLNSVEVITTCRMVRLYTHSFITFLARTGRRPGPIRGCRGR